jgi:hypothetical protein
MIRAFSVKLGPSFRYRRSPKHCPIKGRTSSRLMLLSLDSPNMTSEGSSSISLALSSLSQRSTTAFTFAEAFHVDFLRCTDEAQRRRVCCDYRDKILDISKFTDILAAAFNAPFLGLCGTLLQRDTRRRGLSLPASCNGKRSRRAVKRNDSNTRHVLFQSGERLYSNTMAGTDCH